MDWIGFGSQILSDPEAPGVLNRGAAVINEFTKTKSKADLLAGALERNLLLAPITTTRELLDMDHAAETTFLEADWRSEICWTHRPTIGIDAVNRKGTTQAR